MKAPRHSWTWTAATLVGALSSGCSGAGSGTNVGAGTDTSAPRDAASLQDDAQVRGTPNAQGDDSGRTSASEAGGFDVSAGEGGVFTPGGMMDGPAGFGTTDGGAVEAGGGGDAGVTSTDGAVIGNRSAGCGKTVLSPSPTVQQTMQVNGTTRYYLLTVPAGYSPTTPMPVVFAFHGLNMNNVWASQGGGYFGSFNLQAGSGGQAILVFPQGSGSPPGNSTTFSGSSSWNNNAADMGFFDGLVGYIEDNYCVDKGRIFAVGFSMGAMFANALGCDRAGTVRGIAPVDGWGPGSPPTSGTPSCPSSMGKAAMVTHGTKDGTIPYSIGQASAEFWRTASGCSATPAPSTAFPNCVGYQGCQTGKEVYFCTHSGNHQVPSFAGMNMWNFFSALH